MLDCLCCLCLLLVDLLFCCVCFVDGLLWLGFGGCVVCLGGLVGFFKLVVLSVGCGCLSMFNVYCFRCVGWLVWLGGWNVYYFCVVCVGYCAC